MMMMMLLRKPCKSQASRGFVSDSWPFLCLHVGARGSNTACTIFYLAVLQISGLYYFLPFLAVTTYGRDTVRVSVRISTDGRPYFYIPNTRKVYFTMAE